MKKRVIKTQDVVIQFEIYDLAQSRFFAVFHIVYLFQSSIIIWITEVSNMPRGKRKTALESITEQLTQIDAQMQVEHDKLKSLEAKKKELLDLQKKQELDDLYSKIKASGKSVEEVLAVLNNK
jgi:uncharacterized protein YoxC